MKRRYCLRKEDFVYERKVLFSYIAFHLHICYKMNKLRNDLFVYERKIFAYERKVLSMKGRFYYRIYCSTSIYLLQN